MAVREYPAPVERLIEAFMCLPTVGPKTASRLAFHILQAPYGEVKELAQALLEVKKSIRDCSICGNLTEKDVCLICLDERRKDDLLCVVADVKDLVAIEKTGEFKGRYHVLGGLLSPFDGIGPEQLRIKQLLSRVDGSIEVILATDPTVAGEATALYLHKLLSAKGVKVTRLAQGLPMGADLEYADEVTLGRALVARREMV